MQKDSFIGKEKNELREAVDGLLEEGYVLWNEAGLTTISENDRYDAVDAAGLAYSGPCRRQFAAACQSFFLFRRLHETLEKKEIHTLLGDYFFSQFSLNIIPLDNIPLIDAFSEYLVKDTCNGYSASEYNEKEIKSNKSNEDVNLKDYLEFISGLSSVMVS